MPGVAGQGPDGSGGRSGYESYAAVGPLGPPPPTGWDGGVPPAPPSPGNGSGKTFALVLVAVAVALLLGVGTFFVVRSLTDDETSSARQSTPDPTAQGPTQEPSDDFTLDAPPTDGQSDDPSADPTPDSPTDPSTEEPSVLQCTGGLPTQGVTGQQGRLMTGGGLQLPQPADYESGLDQSLAFTFADGVYAPSKIIEQGATSGWVAVYALGSLSRGNGFDSPRQAAETVVACMTQSADFYQDLTGSTELASSETVVDGLPAWQLTEEIRIDNPDLEVEGDIAKVVVVDTGDGETYGLFVSVVPIGDEAMIDQQDAAVGKLKVR